MAAADHHRGLVLAGQAADGVSQLVEFGAQQGHRRLQLQRQAGVEHVRAGHAHVDVAPGITHVLIDVGEKGDHVVAHLGLDLENASHTEGRLGLDRGDGLGRHVAELAVGLGGGDLHIQPALELGLFAPEVAHLGQGVTLDQGRRGLTVIATLPEPMCGGRRGSGVSAGHGQAAVRDFPLHQLTPGLLAHPAPPSLAVDQLERGQIGRLVHQLHEAAGGQQLDHVAGSAWAGATGASHGH